VVHSSSPTTKRTESGHIRIKIRQRLVTAFAQRIDLPAPALSLLIDRVTYQRLAVCSLQLAVEAEAEAGDMKIDVHTLSIWSRNICHKFETWSRRTLGSKLAFSYRLQASLSKQITSFYKVNSSWETRPSMLATAK